MSDQGVAQLMSMLRDRNRAHPSEWSAMDARITERFRATRAVMFTDLSGFSKTTADQGIVAFLARIERVLHICVPIVESHAGRLIKTIGDDLMCDFRSAESAVQAAADMQDALDSERFAHDGTIKMGVGIGFGVVKPWQHRPCIAKRRSGAAGPRATAADGGKGGTGRRPRARRRGSHPAEEPRRPGQGPQGAEEGWRWPRRWRPNREAPRGPGWGRLGVVTEIVTGYAEGHSNTHSP